MERRGVSSVLHRRDMAKQLIIEIKIKEGGGSSYWGGVIENFGNEKSLIELDDLLNDTGYKIKQWLKEQKV